MIKHVFLGLALTVAVTGSALAQAPRAAGSGLNGALTKLFGENTAFSADIVLQMETAEGKPTVLPGKMAFNGGDSRLEINLANAKGNSIGTDFADRMKSMGMDTTVTISRPEKKIAYLIYPGLSAYIETKLQTGDAKPTTAYKVTSTELGAETIDGHPCIKNKVVVTDDEGNSHESTVWNATDLKKFPLKIATSESGLATTMVFSHVDTAKPAAALFDPPSKFKKYDNKQTLIVEEMKKHIATPAPPARP